MMRTDSTDRPGVPTTDTDDWRLVKSGDRAAFERIFQRHADTVHRFLARRCGDVGIAEDLVGEVFLQAWRQRHRVDLHHGSLRPWLFGVANNLVRRHWRGRSRFGRAIARLPRPDQQPGHDEAIATSIDAQRRLERLRDAVESLPRAHAEVVLLRAWEGLDYEAIATVLDIPVGTVRSRLSRARTRLRDQLAGEDDTPAPAARDDPPTHDQPRLHPSTAERRP